MIIKVYICDMVTKFEAHLLTSLHPVYIVHMKSQTLNLIQQSSPKPYYRFLWCYTALSVECCTTFQACPVKGNSRKCSHPQPDLGVKNIPSLISAGAPPYTPWATFPKRPCYLGHGIPRPFPYTPSMYRF